MDAQMTLRCQHVFCADCCEKLLANASAHGNCPLCREPAALDSLVPVPHVGRIVTDLPVYCAHRPRGCAHRVPLSDKYTHQRQCEFRAAVCEHKAVGCEWSGTQRELPLHVAVCAFQTFREYIRHTDERLVLLEKLFNQQREELRALKRFVIASHVNRAPAGSSSYLPPRPFASDGADEDDEDDEEPIDVNALGLASPHHNTDSPPPTQSAPVAIAAAATSSIARSTTASPHRNMAPSIAAPLSMSALSNSGGTLRSANATPTTIDDDSSPRQKTTATATATATATTPLLTTTTPGGPQAATSDTSIKSRWAAGLLELQQTLYGSKFAVTSLAWSNGVLFSGSHDANIRVWAVVPARDLDAEELAMATSEQRAASSSASSSSTISTLQNATYEYRCVGMLKGHKLTVWALLARGDRLYSASADGTIKRWSVAAMDCEKNAVGHDGKKIYTMAANPRHLFTAGADRKIQVWSVIELEPVQTIDAHRDVVWSLAVRGDLLYSCSDDQTVKMWDLQSYANVKTLEDQRNSKFLSLAVGNGYICAGTNHCWINVWELHSCVLERTLTGHSWEVWQLVINHTLLFSGSFDHQIRIWDMNDWTCVRVLAGHTGYIHALIVPDTNHVYSASGDKTIKFWSCTV
jgi:WD40 repeat protein